jgi:uncharacterized membrane protein
MGLVVLVPLSILFLAVMEAYGLLEDMSDIAELQLPFPAFVNTLVFFALGALAVFAACFLTGLLLRTRAGKRIGEFVEKGIAEKVPLLGLIRKLTLSLTGTDSKLKPVEADVHGSGAPMLGFLMETLADGRYVVFIPTSPAITFGHTYIVPPERVTILDADLTTVVNVITQWGAGAQEIYQPDDESN